MAACAGVMFDPPTSPDICTTDWVQHRNGNSERVPTYIRLVEAEKVGHGPTWEIRDLRFEPLNLVCRVSVQHWYEVQL